tara:strand:- start:850 stop:966 length:117 start_codon:yes stop_codon:yes gene_type:complete
MTTLEILFALLIIVAGVPLLGALAFLFFMLFLGWAISR